MSYGTVKVNWDFTFLDEDQAVDFFLICFDFARGRPSNLFQHPASVFEKSLDLIIPEDRGSISGTRKDGHCLFDYFINSYCCHFLFNTLCIRGFRGDVLLMNFFVGGSCSQNFLCKCDSDFHFFHFTFPPFLFDFRRIAGDFYAMPLLFNALPCFSVATPLFASPSYSIVLLFITVLCHCASIFCYSSHFRCGSYLHSPFAILNYATAIQNSANPLPILTVHCRFTALLFLTQPSLCSSQRTLPCFATAVRFITVPLRLTSSPFSAIA